jgi:release factor glutamine methyltransferase
LLSEILQCKRLDLYLKFDQPLKPVEVNQYREWIARRGKFEPLQYIVGKVDFYGLSFIVTPDVLIPRPETEILVDTIVNEYKTDSSKKILDIGVGSGCIAVSIAKNLVGSEVTGIDISGKAINVACKNSDTNGTSENLKLIVGDIKEHSFKNKFDAIVSNPPYVSKQEYATLQKEIIDYEPAIALTDDNDGLEFYRIIACKLNLLMNAGGKIYFEVGLEQSEKVVEILQANEVSNIKIIKDLSQIDRIVAGVKE